jgi:hypothetical protein
VGIEFAIPVLDKAGAYRTDLLIDAMVSFELGSIMKSVLTGAYAMIQCIGEKNGAARQPPGGLGCAKDTVRDLAGLVVLEKRGCLMLFQAQARQGGRVELTSAGYSFCFYIETPFRAAEEKKSSGVDLVFFFANGKY